MKLYNRTIKIERSCRLLGEDNGIWSAITILFLASYLSLISCDDFITVSPPRDQVISATVFADDAAAISAIKGIYSEIVRNSFADGSSGSITLQAGLSADDFINHYSGYDETYQNSLTAEDSYVSRLWNSPYRNIYYANSVIEGLGNASSNVTDATRNQLEGEAKFIRAFCHFYLVNLFGDVPIVTTTDYRLTRNLPRAPVSQVYDQIVADLNDAQDLLADDYSYSNRERVRVNSWAATAMLARVYLYMEDWTKAEVQATEVINNTADFTLLSDLDQVFLRNSEEAIWQLLSISPSANTFEGSTFIFTTTPSGVSLSNGLLNAFEPGDQRRVRWIGSTTPTTETYYFPYKYKIGGFTDPKEEYSMVLRLAEQYLIRAEARAQQGGDLTGAIADVDAIRGRANLPLIANTNPDINQADLLDAIMQERRIELFSEWGHRWLDLKRTGRADAVLGPLKGSTWQSTDVLYPIPQSELENNPNLTPNEGY